MRTRALLLLCLLPMLLPAVGAAQGVERLEMEALGPYGGPLDVGRVAQSRPVASGSAVGSLFFYLRDFHQPWIQVHAGVAKPDQPGLRYADVLVVERAPPTGQLPRVETFSFKSRDLRFLREGDLKAQMLADAKSAFDYYGGMVDIRTPELGLRDILVPVQRVRLIYEGKFKPQRPDILERAMERTQKQAKETEVSFQ